MMLIFWYVQPTTTDVRIERLGFELILNKFLFSMARSFPSGIKEVDGNLRCFDSKFYMFSNLSNIYSSPTGIL